MFKVPSKFYVFGWQVYEIRAFVGVRFEITHLPSAESGPGYWRGGLRGRLDARFLSS